MRRCCHVSFLLALLVPGVAFADTQTILFVRHGEKPAAGLGQLSCKGLNRALALPAMLAARYGRIDAVYAPNPAQEKPDGKGEDGAAQSYDYVRPLATVEPTAIALGLPVEVNLGYAQTDELKAALLDPRYRRATVLVGWEHHAMNALVPRLVASLGGDAGQVPKWAKPDFDAIWRVTIERTGERTTVGFHAEREGLDGLPDTCPTVRAP